MIEHSVPNNHNSLWNRFLNSSVGRYWRIFATGLAFFIFGLAGVFGSLTVIPVILLTSIGRPVLTQRMMQGFISWWFRRFFGLMHTLGLLTYEFHNVKKLQTPGQLIIANHPSLIDVVFLIGLSKYPSCLVSGRFWKNLATRASVNAAGYVSNAHPDKLITDCAKTLHSGKSLIIFPEGTRTTPNQPVKSQRGAANIAINAMHDFTPVWYTCNPTTLTKNEPWWNSPKRRPHWRIEVLDPIPDKPFINSSASNALAARKLTQYLDDYFNALNTYGHDPKHLPNLPDSIRQSS